MIGYVAEKLGGLLQQGNLTFLVLTYQYLFLKRLNIIFDKYKVNLIAW